jgi:hypothetical protein
MRPNPIVDLLVDLHDHQLRQHRDVGLVQAEPFLPPCPGQKPPFLAVKRPYKTP